MNILDGLLLGDGGVYNHNRGYMKGKSFFGQTCKYEEYLHYIKSMLEQEGLEFPDKCITPYMRKLKHREGYTKEYRLTSRFSPYLYDQRCRWYPYNVKRVPKDITLTTNVLREWYIGDGSLITWRNYLWNVKLCVLGYDEYDNVFLKNLLVDLGFSSRFNKKRGEINVNRSNVPKFLSFIGSCPVDCYKYKWDLENLSKVHPNTQIKREKLLQQEK